MKRIEQIVLFIQSNLNYSKTLPPRHQDSKK